MTDSKVHILGGGVIGLCCAWYLRKEGFAVTVIDRGNLTQGTSFGNAGMIVPSHFIPMASPGVITKGLKWMLNSKSPFYIRPRLSLPLTQWLWKFYRSSSSRHVRACMPVLRSIHEWSRELYREFANSPGFEFDFQQRGLLMLFQTLKQEKEELEVAEMAHELGLDAKMVEGADLARLEPEMELEARGGVYFPGDAHLYPDKFLLQLRKELCDLGVQFQIGKEVVGLLARENKLIGYVEGSGEKTEVDQMVVAAGAWTGRIMRSIGFMLPLQDGKGYSFTLREPGVKPRIPTILSEAKVAITPMGADLRIGGTLELSGMSIKVNEKRLKGMLESIPRYYRNLDTGAIQIKQAWQGYRPCSPDGMPYIGGVPGIKNLFLATGHGMMGMSLGPATGKLISQLISRQKTSLDTHLFRTDRF